MIRQFRLRCVGVNPTWAGECSWPRASWLAAWVLLLALAGCQSSQQDGVVEAGDSDVFSFTEEVKPPTQVADGRKLFNPVAELKRYKVLAGKPEGAVVESRMIAAPGGPAPGGEGYTHPIPLRPGVRFLRFTPGARIEHIGFDEQGGAVMIAVEDLNESPIATVTYYDPPLPYIPADLKPGAQIKLQSKMSIRKRSNLDSELDSGMIDKTVSHTADVTIRWSGGATAAGGKPLQITCHRIQTQFTASLKLAKVSGVILEDYHPIHGVVREEWEENVRAFLFGWQTKRTMIWNGRIER